ncbi:MAG TPA: hypothetical protein VN920_13290 [Pyrinomonadaceae bacterium]|nr:hypothetical protein [Pyrinomonadaceae bacterium]
MLCALADIDNLVHGMNQASRQVTEMRSYAATRKAGWPAAALPRDVRWWLCPTVVIATKIQKGLRPENVSEDHPP